MNATTKSLGRKGARFAKLVSRLIREANAFNFSEHASVLRFNLIDHIMINGELAATRIPTRELNGGRRWRRHFTTRKP